MIRETTSSKNVPALTSDHWHVVVARFSSEAAKKPFVRSIVSEHANRDLAVTAARSVVKELEPARSTKPVAQREQVFVRKPEFKTLKLAARVDKHRK